MKPRGMDMALSITTSPDNPYADEVDGDGFIVYHYQGTDPHRYDNVAVRQAGVEGVPLIYFHGVARGQYQPFWPAFVQHDDVTSRTFRVAVDELVRGYSQGVTHFEGMSPGRTECVLAASGAARFLGLR